MHAMEFNFSSPLVLAGTVPTSRTWFPRYRRRTTRSGARSVPALMRRTDQAIEIAVAGLKE